MQTSLTETKYKGASIDFLRMFNKQEEYNYHLQEVKRLDEELKQMAIALQGQTDKVFEVYDMNKRRTIDSYMLKKEKPELFEKYAKLKNTDIGKILLRHNSMSDIIENCRSLDSEMTEAALSVTISDLQKAIGKDGVDKLPGNCFNITYSAKSQEPEWRIRERPDHVARLPHFNPYPTHDDECDYDE